jgi:hypothetical protein
MKSDLLVWKEFLHNFNGLSYIPEKNWSTNYDLQLFTDSTGVEAKGCGAFYAVKWAHLQWPSEWKSTPLLRDITNKICNMPNRRRRYRRHVVH